MTVTQALAKKYTYFFKMKTSRLKKLVLQWKCFFLFRFLVLVFLRERKDLSFSLETFFSKFR